MKAVFFAAFLLLGGCTVFDGLVGANESRLLQETGRPAKAVVLDLWDTGITLNDDPVVGLLVEVAPGSAKHYQAVIPKTLVSRVLIPQVQPGCVLPVWIDRANPSRVAVDPAAVR